MKVKTVKRLLATFAVLAILLASLPLAMANGGDKSGSMEKYGGDKSKSGEMIDGVYMVIAKSDQGQMPGQAGRQMQDRDQAKSAKMHPFGITELAITGKDGKAAVFSFDQPLQGVYDMSDDMAYISTANFKSSQVRMDRPENLALKTSGASAIVKLEGIKPLYKGDDYSLMKFNELYMIKPDGQAQEFKLAKPVTIIYSRDRNLAVIDAYPTLTRSIAGSFTGAEATTFSGDSISMNEIMRMEESAKENKVPYERRETVKEPAREISQGT